MILAAAIGFALGAAGCLPDRVTIDLSPGDGRLKASTVLADDGAGDTAPMIALIDVRGLILDAPSFGVVGPGPNPVDELTNRLEEAAKDPAVRAIILRINSPGGAVTSSDTCYREVRRFAERTGKPVVASLADVAASGGYYIALGADEIVAQPTTVTGSIGVIFQTFNFSEGMARWGVQGRSVVSGPNKAIASPFEPAQERHYAILQGIVDEFAASFRALVAERRPGLSAELLATYTDGRVVTGAEAVRLGLADEVGDVRDAFECAKRLAKLSTARLVKYHAEGSTPRTPYALGGVDPARSAATTINLMQVNLASGLADSGAGFYYLWIPPTP
jgi:protease-4